MFFKRRRIGSRDRILQCIFCMMIPILLMTMGLFQMNANAAGTSKTGDVEIEFKNGGLKLLSAPIFDFGRHPRPSEVTYYAARSIGPNPMKIQDLNGKGWKLMAKLSTASSGGTTLDGASVIFNTKAEHIKDGSLNPHASPPSVGPAEVKAGGAAVAVMSAPAGTPTNTWVIDWKADSTSTAKQGVSTGKDVEIKIMGTAAKNGSAKATLDWDLVDAP